MSKFIQTVDTVGNPVIINLEAITHVSKTHLGLAIYFENQVFVVLEGEQCDIFWEFMTKASWQINQQAQEEDKK